MNDLGVPQTGRQRILQAARLAAAGEYADFLNYPGGSEEEESGT